MLGTAIRIYRCRHGLSQGQLAEKVLLNQRDISDLELGKVEVIARFNAKHERFQELQSLMEKSAEVEPIEIFHYLTVPDRFNIETDHGAEWIAVTPESRLLECRALFADRADVAIVTKCL